MVQYSPVGFLGALGGARRSGAGWAPTDLGASLLAWWSADRSDLITLSGAQVTSWKDIVAAYDAVQGVASARPLYSATSFGGSSGLTFDATDDELTLPSVPFPTGATPCEMWALVDQQRTTAMDTAGRTIAAYGDTAAASQRRFLRTVNTGTNRVAVQTGNGVTTGLAESGAEFFGRHVARGIIAATESTAGLDGVLGTPATITPSTGTTRFRIGALANNTATAIWGGVMRDVIVTTPLSVAQATLLNTYLMNRRNP